VDRAGPAGSDLEPPIGALWNGKAGKQVAAHSWLICRKRSLLGSRLFERRLIRKLSSGHGRYVVKSALGLLLKPLPLQLRATPPYS
jgi:hypothetical protein